MYSERVSCQFYLTSFKLLFISNRKIKFILNLLHLLFLPLVVDIILIILFYVPDF